MKNIVVFGGGNGCSVVLEALKNFDDVNLSAVISVSDSGGSSGVLRSNLNTLPPGDILRAVLSLSVYDYQILKNIFYKNRFDSLEKLSFGKNVSHNLGNVFLTLAAQYENNWIAAIRALETAVEARGAVYPVTISPTELVAELSDGSVLRGEGVIDRPVYDRALRIKRAWLEPQTPAFSEAVTVISKADYIIISPGSLYTSLVPVLAPAGISDAIKNAKAKLIYVTALSCEKEGETGPECLSEFVSELERYLPCAIDTVVYNSFVPSADDMKKYTDKKWLVFDKDVENIKNKDVWGFDYENPGEGYDAKKLSKVLEELFRSY